MKTMTMRKSHALAMCAIAAVAVASLGFARSAQAAEGWQGVSTFNVPKGQVNQQYGYNCPAAYPHATNGSFAMNAAGQTSQVFLSFNGPRIDIPSFSEWAWHFYWPAGAPVGVSILFDVYCMP
jgi:hypothetical protein